MADPTIERLRDRYDQLARQDNVGFVRQISTYLKTLDSDRRVRNILRSLRIQADAAEDRFSGVERGSVAELVQVRQRLAAAAPEIDDSHAPAPDQGSQEYGFWKYDSLASFDRVADSEPEIGYAPMPYYGSGEPGRVRQLCQILRGRLYEAEYGVQGGRGHNPQQKVRDDLGEYAIEIDNVQAHYEAASRQFKQEETGLAGPAEKRLRVFVDSLTPEPFLRDPNEPEEAFMERAFAHVADDLGARGLLRRVVDGDRLDPAEREVFERLARFLRGEAERLHEEVVDRLRQGEGEAKGWRLLRAIGRGSLALGSAFILAIAGALATVFVGWALGWFSESRDHNPPPTRTGSTPGGSTSSATTTTKP